MNKPRLTLQWETQPVHFRKTLCSLLESQILVDMTIISNSYSIKVHKCVMAANSTYFREQLQKEPLIDKVVINGIKHPILKSLVEFMYCGETSVYEENFNEFLAAANYFDILGLKTIMPNKIGLSANETKDLFMQIKPPVFFSKNEKVRSVRHNNYGSDNLYGEDDVKVVLEGGNYEVFNSSKRQNQNSLIVNEAHMALEKEEAASRHALEMLQKNISVTSFVIEDTCTEATVETSLGSQYRANNFSQKECNENTETQDSLIPISESYKIQDGTEMVDHTDMTESKSNDKIKDCLPNDISSDFPIIYKASDGTYVNVSNEMFRNLAQSGAVHYQIVHDDGHLGEFQQFVCNNYNNTQLSNSEEISQISDNKQPMTLKQLVAETVSPDYPNDMNNLIIVPHVSTEHTAHESSAQSTSEVGDISFNNYIVEKGPVHYQENDLLGKSLGFGDNGNSNLHENLNESILGKVITTPMKRKRGRPRKVKLENEFKECSKMSFSKFFKERTYRTDENYPSVQQITEELFIPSSQNEQKFDITSNQNEPVSINSNPHQEIYELTLNENEDIPIAPSSQNEEKFDPPSTQNNVNNYTDLQVEQNFEINSNRNDTQNIQESAVIVQERNLLLDLESLGKDLSKDISLTYLSKEDKNVISPKIKRRCTRSFNKENICPEIE